MLLEHLLSSVGAAILVVDGVDSTCWAPSASELSCVVDTAKNKLRD